MIIFSKVLADRGTVWDAIRAREVACAEAPDDLIRFSSEVKPVVMWNITRECNLSCKHCYMDARSPHPDEWTLDEGIRFIDEMARLEMPMLIVTGGEPLMSKNFFPFAFHAKEKGVRMVISTNGTLITPEVAVLLAEADIRYVGVSVDAATAEMHDAFRGVTGAFDRAMDGIKNAQEAGLKTGLRITIQKENWQEVPKLLDLCVEKEIPRFCLYHLVPTGRGKHIMEELDVTKEQRTQVLKYLYDSAINLRDKEIEILTTDSPMDGVYILERLKREDPERFDQVRELLQVSGGCSIGNKVANVDYLGNVNPCHFTPQMSVGNVKERSFDEIWNGNPGEQLLEIRERRKTLDGTCGRCEYMDVCGGCRQKAYFYEGDFYGGDPTCIYDPDKKRLEYELF